MSFVVLRLWVMALLEWDIARVWRGGTLTVRGKFLPFPFGAFVTVSAAASASAATATSATAG